jgi:hypothetical protein
MHLSLGLALHPLLKTQLRSLYVLEREGSGLGKVARWQ